MMMSAMSSLTVLRGICQRCLPKQFVKLFQSIGQSSIGRSRSRPLKSFKIYVINLKHINCIIIILSYLITSNTSRWSESCWTATCIALVAFDHLVYQVSIHGFSSAGPAARHSFRRHWTCTTRLATRMSSVKRFNMFGSDILTWMKQKEKE